MTEETRNGGVKLRNVYQNYGTRTLVEEPACGPGKVIDATECTEGVTGYQDRVGGR